MRLVIQRVTQASVTVADQILGEIESGLVVLVGVGVGDGEADTDYLADKIVHLRIFEDADGKMNRSLLEIGGRILAVPQFTLYGETRKGRRPSFDRAAPPQLAKALFDRFVERVTSRMEQTPEIGRFGAHMQIHLVNDGPVTLVMDSP
ncbi:MAG: D-aminoacyl-tRNA deacylase [Candidatus Bipolaricaulia bacterium]